MTAPSLTGWPARILALSTHLGAMDATRTFRHQDYELLCSAKPMASGRYTATLVVCKQVWPTRPRVIAMRHVDYGTEGVAIDAAHAQGVEWILNYG